MPPVFSEITDGQTFLNPLGMVFTLLMGVLLIVLPRKYAFVPILALVCYMTMGMRLMVGGLNFTMLRILLLFGWARLVLRGELGLGKLNQIDKAVLWFTAVSTIAYLILWHWEYDAFKNQMGQAYDHLGFYFLFRCLIRDWEDGIQLLRVAGVMIVPLALEMLMEYFTLRNQFSLFGGVGGAVWVRDGTPRCQGPFVHPILAGSFGAGLVPCFVGLGLRGRGNLPIAAIGAAAALIITLTSGSSGPVFACLIGLMALGLWPLRWQMQLFRWAVSLSLITLHMVMKAPVWFLIARASVYDSSTGFHRAYLIDRAVVNFSDWWLVGVTTTANWGYYLFDVTNQYVLAGVNGGVFSLALFVTVMVRCFRGVGRLMRVDTPADPGHLQPFVWALGAAIMVHAASFISVSYFDQNLIMWYLLQALIASLCASHLDSKLRVQEAAPVVKEDVSETVWFGGVTQGRGNASS